MWLNGSKVRAIVAAAMLASGVLLGAPRADAGSEPYLGEIAFVGFSFCPNGWLPADGRTLSISQNTALFSLLGTTYGGDGRTTFELPDLRRQIVDPGEGKDPKHRMLACVAINGIFPPRP